MILSEVEHPPEDVIGQGNKLAENLTHLAPVEKQEKEALLEFYPSASLAYGDFFVVFWFFFFFCNAPNICISFVVCLEMYLDPPQSSSLVLWYSLKYFSLLVALIIFTF